MSKGPFRPALLVLMFSVSTVQPAGPVSADTQGERLNVFFEEVHQAALKRWPEWQSHLGIKGDQDKWNDYGEAKRIAEHEITRRNLDCLLSEFDFDRLIPKDRVSYRPFEHGAELSIAYFPFRHHNYPINYMGGAHKSLRSSRLAGRMLAAAPKSGGTRQGEGSILGGLGDLIDGN